VSGAPLLTRTRARGLATLGAGLALVLAMYTAGVESMPEFHAYDGWRWPRQRSLPVIVLAAVLGSWLPFVWLAHQGHVPLWSRLKGAWWLMGADVIGAAIPVGVACLWFAVREPDRSS
jgi:F0F1-type ATP synthase membrane subunit c/vacuolar-type H+-ATPase subunit K